MFESFRQRFLVRFWSPMPAVIALGIMSAYYLGIVGTHWAVTGEFTRWGGHILQFFGVDTSAYGYFKLVGIFFYSWIKESIEDSRYYNSFRGETPDKLLKIL